MKSQSRLLRFFGIGILAVSIDWILFYFLSSQLSIGQPLAKAVSFISGTIFAFILNGLITFNSLLTSARLLRHLLLYSISMLFNTLIYQLISNSFKNGNEKIHLGALVVATCASTTINYSGMHFWVFPKEGRRHG